MHARMVRFRRSARAHAHQAAYEGVLGTSLDFTAMVSSLTAGPAAEAAALAEIDRLESIFSLYRADSEFNRFQHTRGEWISISTDLAFVLLAAEQARVASLGAFSPAAHAYLSAWTDAGHGTMNALAPLWEVDPAGRAIRLTDSPASLNALAKGYIVDRAAEAALLVPDVESVLVNIGGDLRHAGHGGALVAITDPATGAQNSVPIASVRIQNSGVASSGGYRRTVRRNGEAVSHVVDPRIGEPISTRVTASALAATTMEADIWATILSVLEVERGLAEAERAGVGGLVVDDGGLIHTNPHWRRFKA